MPEARFYVPDYQFDTLQAFKRMFGRNWGQLLLEFMNQKVNSQPAMSREQQVELIFKKYFGDITNEREFIDMMGIEDAQTAVRRRVRDACSANKDHYDDLINMLRDKLPRLAELGGYRK